MARSKYINTFNTTAEYDAYIESAYPEFPNVGYDKEAEEVKIMRTSPNDHLIYGTLTDPSQAPVFRFKSSYGTDGYNLTAHTDPINNTFYIDSSDLTSQYWPATKLNYFIVSDTNITSILKIDLDTINVKEMTNFIDKCSNLKTLNLNGCDFSNVTTTIRAFNQCSSLTDVYITYETTLNKLTNNLRGQSGAYIPLTATIHYDNGSEVILYKWQNNAWTPQN